nr:ulp1 protease family, C-terminal catalytic domain-containing protein [Ipomoea batatas]
MHCVPRSWGLCAYYCCHHNHFYLLCVDFKIEWLEIIDNSASTEATRKLLLSGYFTSVGEKFKSIIFENLKCKRMPMKWRDTKNKVDCGIYLMRHMESYTVMVSLLEFDY